MTILPKPLIRKGCGKWSPICFKKCGRDKACLVSTCLASTPLNGISMVTQEKLGGFKILKEVSLISPAPFMPDRLSPRHYFGSLRNITSIYPTSPASERSDGWLIDLAVEAGDARTASGLIQKALERNLIQRSNTAILSIFPHRKKAHHRGALFEAFDREGIHPDVMAHSPSTISVVLDEQVLVRAGRSPFWSPLLSALMERLKTGNSRRRAKKNFTRKSSRPTRKNAQKYTDLNTRTGKSCCGSPWRIQTWEH